MATGDWWEEVGPDGKTRGERFRGICLNFMNDFIQDFERSEGSESNFWKFILSRGMTRSTWRRYAGLGEKPAVPSDIGRLGFVAALMDRTKASLEAEIEGIPYAPEMEDFSNMEDWAKSFSDNDFRQLCQVSTPDRVTRFVAIATKNLMGRIKP